MAYTKARADWIDYPNNTTPITAANLETIEQGIFDAAAAADAAIPKTLIDAKGDLIVGTAADTAGRVAVGADGQVLTADAASASGVKWAAAAGGGGSDPWTYVVATADTNNSTLTAVNAAGLGVTGLADGLYVLEWLILISTATAGVSPRVGLTWGSGVTLHAYMQGTNSATMGAPQAFANLASASSLSLETTVPIGNGSTFLGVAASAMARISTMASTIQTTIKSEADTLSVAIKADSIVRYRKIAD